MSEKNQNYITELTSNLIAMALIISFLYVLRGALIPLMFSILIAISLYPVSLWFERLQLGKTFSALISVLLAIILISGLIWSIVHQVIVIGRNGLGIQE